VHILGLKHYAKTRVAATTGRVTTENFGKATAGVVGGIWVQSRSEGQRGSSPSRLFSGAATRPRYRIYRLIIN
jgi:hypothetical protein